MTCDHCGASLHANRFFTSGLCFGCAAMLLRDALAKLGIAI